IRHFNQGSKGFGFEQIDGVDWDGYARMNGIGITSGYGPQGMDEVVIDETKARQNNLKIGDTMKPLGDKSFRIVGIYAPESGARVKMPLAAMQQGEEAEGKCTFIFVKLKDDNQIVEMDKRTEHELPSNSIQGTRDVFTKIESSSPKLRIFIRVLV